MCDLGCGGIGNSGVAEEYTVSWAFSQDMVWLQCPGILSGCDIGG